jgi:hypothetical protein
MVNTNHALDHLVSGTLMHKERTAVFLMIKFLHFKCHPSLLSFFRLLFGLLYLFLHVCHLREGFHDNGEEEIQKKVGAYKNQEREIDGRRNSDRIHIVVHYLSPTFKGHYAEDLNYTYT